MPDPSPNSKPNLNPNLNRNPIVSFNPGHSVLGNFVWSPLYSECSACIYQHNFITSNENIMNKLFRNKETCK